MKIQAVKSGKEYTIRPEEWQNFINANLDRNFRIVDKDDMGTVVTPKPMQFKSREEIAETLKEKQPEVYDAIFKEPKEPQGEADIPQEASPITESTGEIQPEPPIKKSPVSKHEPTKKPIKK